MDAKDAIAGTISGARDQLTDGPARLPEPPPDMKGWQLEVIA
jgi:hypothetical protein